MKKVKTITLIIIAVCFMMLGIIGISPKMKEVYAMNVNFAFGGCGENLIWNLNPEGVLTISGTGAMKNYTCKSEMPWYQYISDIKKVVLEEGVTTISDYAFYGMPNVTSITIPESVVSIGAYAFKGSTALEDVVLPSKLTQLGESAFYGCTSLTEIDIPASLYTVRSYTFKNCTSLEKVIFHEGNLQKLSEASFYGTALKKIIIPNCVTIVDVYCFKNCNQLTSVTLSSNMTEIREAVFYGTAIPTIKIPEGVTKIGPYAFKNCTKLVNINFPTTLTTVEEASFYACTSLGKLVFPDAVTAIGDYAFRKCENIASVTFPADLYTIGESTFYGCIGLKSLNFPEGLTEIKGYAFKGCTGMMDIKFPDSLKIIGESAFHSCTLLNQIMISANVEMIGEYAFSSCGVLKEIQFVGDAPVIGKGAFSKLTAEIYYPADNGTWNSDIMKNYGGTIDWIGDSYTYAVIYESSNGVNLGNTIIAYRYGSEHTISAPTIEGYVTPEEQTIWWDSTEPKTITFIYVPEKVFVSQEMAAGEWCIWDEKYGIMYTVYAEYQNRTVDSVDVRIAWYNTLGTGEDGECCRYGYSQYFNAKIAGESIGERLIADASLWESDTYYHQTAEVETEWITIPVDATQTSIIIEATFRDSNGIFGSWENEMIIPTF